MNYDYRPIRQNYTAHAVVVLLFALSGVSFVLSGLFPPYSIPWQLLGLVMLLPAIQLIARYMASRYLYRLHTDEQGQAELEIFLYRGGDKMQLVCCIALSQITAVAPLSAANARAPKGIKRYDYAQDLRPRHATVVSLVQEDGACEVLLCPDAYLCGVLTQAAESAKRTSNG